MNLGEYNATKAYRDHLSRTVETARSRMTHRDFQMFAPGIRQEIARLDRQLPKPTIQIRISCAMGLNASTPINQLLSTAHRGTSSIRFNSPTDAVPWTSRIWRNTTVAQTQAASGIQLGYAS
jgi:predicted LPLAT superfamily acyltransferase